MKPLWRNENGYRTRAFPILLQVTGLSGAVAPGIWIIEDLNTAWITNRKFLCGMSCQWVGLRFWMFLQLVVVAPFELAGDTVGLGDYVTSDAHSQVHQHVYLRINWLRIKYIGMFCWPRTAGEMLFIDYVPGFTLVRCLWNYCYIRKVT